MTRNEMELLIRKPDRPGGYPPLLFVHGAYASARCWPYFMNYFAEQGFESRALSLRGHGRSPGYEALWTCGIEEYVDDVCRAAREMPEPPVFVGHSMGGLLVQKALLRSGIRARGAVLLASVPPEGMLLPAFWMMFTDPVRFQKLGLINMTPPWFWEYWIDLNDIRKIFFSQSTSTESIFRAMSLFQNESPRAAFELMFSPLPHPLQNDTPMLVLGGAEDMIIPPAFVRHTADMFGASVQVFPEMGHTLMLEDNWPTAAACIHQWLMDMIQAREK